MRKYTLIAFLAALTLVWACDDETAVDTPPTSEELIAGEDDNGKTWRINALVGKVNLNGINTDINLLDPPAIFADVLPIDFNCFTDNEFTFFSNNTFTAIEGAVSCADSLDATASGTWTLQDLPDPEVDTLLLSTDANLAIPVAAPLPIESLTATEMIIFYTFVLDEPVTITNPIAITIEKVDVTVTLVSP